MIQYIIQLMLAHGIGEKALKKILNYAIDTTQSLKTICETPELIVSALGNRSNISSIIESIKENEVLAREIAVQLNKAGIKVITENNQFYPQLVKKSLHDDCPPVLFVKGNDELLSKMSVGFCGSRHVSRKGEFITAQCAKQFAEQNITVVSGYASGTDMAAHVSALKNHGNTVFVLAEGILNYKVKQQIEPYLNNINHVFVSQFLPTLQWNVNNAMRRNGLIIGLSRAMILVESGNKGGTFAAGKETLQRKKPLFVIDFEKPEVSAEANPYFIKNGGNPIRGINGIPSLSKVISAINDKSNYCYSEQIKLDNLLCMEQIN